MSQQEIPITLKEQLEADLFYQALGRAMGRWSTLEYYLGLMFRQMTNMEEIVARHVFHSARSWRGRYDMLSGALAASTGKPGVVDSWQCIIDVANKYSAFRNVIAHDHVQLGAHDPRTGTRLLCIRRPISDLSFRSKDPWYHRGHLETAADNFFLLGALVTQAITHRSDDQLGAPERLVWLASQLPSSPHATKVAPQIEAQFDLGLLRQSFPR